MLVIGLLLVLFAIALIVGAVYDGAESARVELLGWNLDTTVAGVFFTGVVVTLLLLLGLALMKASRARSRRRHAERKQLRTKQRESVSQLEQERNELRAENERLAQHGAGSGGPASGGSAAPEDHDVSRRGAADDDTPELIPSGKHSETAYGNDTAHGNDTTFGSGEHAAPANGDGGRATGDRPRSV